MWDHIRTALPLVYIIICLWISEKKGLPTYHGAGIKLLFSLALYRKITFNTKKDLLDQGVLVNVLVVVMLFSSSVFLLLSFRLFFFPFFFKFIIMAFHWVSNTLPPHTHKAKLNKCTVWRSALDIFSVWIYKNDIGQTFLWMKRRSINYKIKNTCSHAWLLHK